MRGSFRVKKDYRKHRPHGPLGTGVVGGFPRIWYYFNTSNSPLADPIMPATAGVFDSVYVNQLAKFHACTLNIQPFTNTGTPENLGVIDALRAVNPALKIWWYDIVQQRFASAIAGSMWKDEYDLVTGSEAGGTGSDRTLKQLDGGNYGQFGFPLWWDVSKDGGAAKLLNLWQTYGRRGSVTGFFLDIISSDCSYPAAPDPDSVDFLTAGYASRAALEAALLAAYLTVTNGLLPYGQVYGNRASYAATATGWEGELFEFWDPDQGLSGLAPPAYVGGLTFDDAMTDVLAWQGTDPTGFGTALIKSEYDGVPYGSITTSSARWQKLARYTLGCACICGGMAHVGLNSATEGGRAPGTLANLNGIFANSDEYAVDGAGTTDPTRALANMGWLGMPTGFGAKDATSQCYVRYFGNGVVIVNGSGSSQTFSLPRQFRHINGYFSTSVNTGATVTSVTVPNKDARFLLNA